MKKKLEIKRVIDSGKLMSFLFGRNGYQLTNTYSDMPTNPNLVIRQILLYLEKSPDFYVESNKLEKGLIELLDTHEGTWLFSYYLLSLILYFKNNESGVKCFNLQDFYTELNHAIVKFSPALEEDDRWTGRNYENGLLGDVNRILNIINRDYASFVKPR